MKPGFLKLVRSEATERLMKDRNALQVLTLIAYRANRGHKKSPGGANQNEAFIGFSDFPDMTVGEYRAAKKRLFNDRLATYLTTYQGTVATLLNSGVWDINAEGENIPNDDTTTPIKKNKQLRTKITASDKVIGVSLTGCTDRILTDEDYDELDMKDIMKDIW